MSELHFALGQVRHVIAGIIDEGEITNMCIWLHNVALERAYLTVSQSHLLLQTITSESVNLCVCT